MFNHRPIMVKEVIANLVTSPDGLYVDGTFGRGGHSAAILNCLSAQGRLVAFDKDPEAVAAAAELQKDSRFTIHHASFARMSEKLTDSCGKINGIFLDLGVSSPQLDDARRGFSFMREGPLDMRMDTSQGESAAEWLAYVSEKTLADVLKVYGEERHARRIAAEIIRERKAGNLLETTTQLAKLVAKASPSHDPHKHPATRTFQAIRIFINRELEEIENFLAQSLSLLALGGRLVVLSFHSLEDRLIKRFIAKEAKGDEFPSRLAVREDQLNKRLKSLSKALKASLTEVEENPRARSAVLRSAEKIA